MISKELEFRGIHKNQLKLYFEELGAKTDGNRFNGENWSGEIVSEKELEFTPAFKVNAVIIRFYARNETELEELIQQYRKKTTRIGG